MIFCQECGQKLEDGLPFCSECGTKVEEEKSKHQFRSAEKVEKKPLSKKNKILIGIGISIIALCGGLYMIGSSYYNEEKVMKRFTTAVQEKDLATIAELSFIDDSNVTIDEEKVKPFLAYVEENPSYLNELTQSFNKRIEGQEVYLSDEIQLVKNGKKFGVFDNYAFKMKSYYVKVETNGKGTVIYNGEQELVTSNKNEFSKELGPFLPGMYQFRAVLEDELVTLEEEKDVVLMNTSSPHVDLHLEGHYITVESNVDDAVLYVNGKEKGKLEEGEIEVGPIPNDGSAEIYLEKEFSFGKIQTKKIKVKKDNYYDVEFEHEVSEQDLERFVEDHLQEWVYAVNFGTFSYVESHYDLSGTSYKTDKEYSKSLYDRNVKEELLTAKLEKAERVNEKQYKLHTYEEFNIMKPDSDPTLKKFNNIYLVTIQDENRILLHSLVENKEVK